MLNVKIRKFKTINESRVKAFFSIEKIVTFELFL